MRDVPSVKLACLWVLTGVLEGIDVPERIDAKHLIVLKMISLISQKEALREGVGQSEGGKVNGERTGRG